MACWVHELTCAIETYAADRPNQLPSEKDSLRTSFLVLEHRRKALIVEFIASHRQSYVSAFEIWSYCTDEKDLSSGKKMYESLDKGVQQSHYGNLIKAKLEELKLLRQR